MLISTEVESVQPLIVLIKFSPTVLLTTFKMSSVETNYSRLYFILFCIFFYHNVCILSKIGKFKILAEKVNGSKPNFL
jgi:hypothetical protein